MIYQAAFAALLTINLTGSGDTPIVPIPADVITLTIATADESKQICDSYPDIVAGIAGATNDYDLATEMVDAWAVVLIEDGYDPSGNSRLTREAREVVLGWLHACPEPFQL